MKLEELYSELKELFETIENLQRKLDYARSHIRSRLSCFSKQEIECMILDGILTEEDLKEVESKVE